MDIVYIYNYREKLKQIYRDARWEAYYDLAVLPLLEQCCPEGLKCVPTHETRKPAGAKKHFIDLYSGIFWRINKKIYKKSGRIRLENYRGGIPDYVIVPDDSTYDDPKEAIVTIEFKVPKNLTGNYQPVNLAEHEMEILHQLSYCRYGILTDGITWYFLRKQQETIDILKSFSLDDSEDSFPELKRNLHCFFYNTARKAK